MSVVGSDLWLRAPLLPPDVVDEDVLAESLGVA